MLIHEQSQVMAKLNKIVRNVPCFRAAEAAGKLTRLPTGDGMALVFFGDPEAPIECAMQIAAELKNCPEIRVRMGIHSGPISQILDVNDRSNVAGAGIDMAQRVMDCGDAGHILVSKRVADDLAPYPRWNHYLHDLGECEVKHGRRISVFNFYTDSLGNPATPEKLRKANRWSHKTAKTLRSVRVSSWLTRPKPLALFLASAAIVVGGWMLFHKLPPPAADKSVAVLPFENLSEEKANAYFTEGIQDEILTRLSKIADLRVISRTSTQHYKSAPENVPEIAHQLKVAYILEGSVQKSADTVRVNVQLIKAADDSHVWAESFDRKSTDIFAVESEVAKAIADQLRAHITGEEAAVLAATPTNNPRAYDAYLRGLAYTLKANTRANSLAAQAAFREAVQLDPSFALSWALLSYNDSLGYISATLEPTAALREEARTAAERALQLRPQLGEALLATGYYHYACLKDYNTAESYFEQARRYLPNSSQVAQALAYLARRRGEWERSENAFRQAENLDPRNVSLLTQHALTYIAQRRFPEARAVLDQALEITPGDGDTLAQKAAIAQAEGDLPAAAALLQSIKHSSDMQNVLEAETYQAMLERRPKPMIARLQQALAHPDPSGGRLTAELLFWLGWAQQVDGDRAGAEATWRQARSEEEVLLSEQPDNFGLMGSLALINLGLGDKTNATALVERASKVLPQEKDALVGPIPLEFAARVAAQSGETERAVTILERLLAIPYSGPFPGNAPLTPALLRLDPSFDALRNDPRFNKLASSQ
ncbi:MAG: CDC27 family protein [Chthoniobacterales bacterium]